MDRRVLKMFNQDRLGQCFQNAYKVAITKNKEQDLFIEKCEKFTITELSDYLKKFLISPAVQLRGISETRQMIVGIIGCQGIVLIHHHRVLQLLGDVLKLNELNLFLTVEIDRELPDIDSILLDRPDYFENTVQDETLITMREEPDITATSARETHAFFGDEFMAEEDRILLRPDGNAFNFENFPMRSQNGTDFVERDNTLNPPQFHESMHRTMDLEPMPTVSDTQEDAVGEQSISRFTQPSVSSMNVTYDQPAREHVSGSRRSAPSVALLDRNVEDFGSQLMTILRPRARRSGNKFVLQAGDLLKKRFYNPFWKTKAHPDTSNKAHAIPSNSFGLVIIIDIGKIVANYFEDYVDYCIEDAGNFPLSDDIETALNLMMEQLTTNPNVLEHQDYPVSANDEFRMHLVPTLMSPQNMVCSTPIDEHNIAGARFVSHPSLDFSRMSQLLQPMDGSTPSSIRFIAATTEINIGAVESFTRLEIQLRSSFDTSNVVQESMLIDPESGSSMLRPISNITSEGEFTGIQIAPVYPIQLPHPISDRILRARPRSLAPQYDDGDNEEIRRRRRRRVRRRRSIMEPSGGPDHHEHPINDEFGLPTAENDIPGGSMHPLQTSAFNENYILSKLMELEGLAKFSDICPKGSGRQMAAKYFMILLEMQCGGIVCMTQNDPIGDPDTLIIELKLTDI